ncbi:MAG: hypothetical protein QW748_03490, partial [Candidatus Methanomethylicaceae archaeon]
MSTDKTKIRVDLSLEEIPKYWYNILPDLPEPMPPPLDPSTKKPISPEALFAIFPKSLVMQEVSTERFVQIPDEVREIYARLGRPTPLIRARRL